MSVLLRHPASVPALFSRAVEIDAPAARGARPWRRLAIGQPLFWAALVLVEVPLVKAAAAAVGLALPH